MAYENQSELIQAGRYVPLFSERQPINSDDKAVVNLGDLWRIARAGKVLIIAMMAVAALVSTIVALSLPREYSSSADVMFNMRGQYQARVEPDSPVDAPDTATLESRIAAITSSNLLLRLIDDLHLDQDPEFNPTLKGQRGVAERLFDGARTWLSAAISAGKTLVDTGSLEQAKSDFLAFHDEVRPTNPVAIRQETLKAVESRLRVDPVGRSRVVRVKFTSEQPEKAAMIANRLSTLYIDSEMEEKKEAAMAAARWLTEQSDSLQEQVAAADRELQTYRATAGFVRTIGDDLAARRIEAMLGLLAEAQAKESQATNQMNQIQGLARSPGTAANHPAVLASTSMTHLRDVEQMLVKDLAEVTSRYGQQHPAYKVAKQKLAENRDAQRLEIQRIISSIQLQAQNATVWRAQIEQQLKAAQQTAHDPNVAVEINSLERRTAAIRTLYESFLTRSKEVVAQISFGQAAASIISDAQVPLQASSPKVRLLVAGSTAVAGILGLAIVFMRQRFSNVVRSSDDVSILAAVHPIAILPNVPRRSDRAANAMLYRDRTAVNSIYAEGMRRMAMLLMMRFDDAAGGRTLMLASSTSGEGKTVTAFDLARTIAAVGKRVVVIDADLRKPELHRLYGIGAGQSGLSDYLCGQAQLDEAVVATASGVDVIVAGTCNGDAIGQILASASRIYDLVATLRNSYDVIIFDTAPVAAAAETLVISRYVGEVFFLVRWNKTNRELVRSAMEKVADIGARISGVIVTRANLRQLPYYERYDNAAYHRSLKAYYRH